MLAIVIPAQAGIHVSARFERATVMYVLFRKISREGQAWIPASAGIQSDNDLLPAQFTAYFGAVQLPQTHG